jgi:two-component system, OmpR family, sensor histidine kinase VanS
VWVRTSAGRDGVTLTVENTGEELAARLVPTLVEPFQRGTERVRTDHASVGLGLRVTVRLPAAPPGGPQPGPTGWVRS